MALQAEQAMLLFQDENGIDDLQKALNLVRQLKSRGVTRWYDLQRVNRQRLDDVDDDEQLDDPHGSLDDDSQGPPAHRPRLQPPMDDDLQAEEYEPTSPLLEVIQ